MHPNLCELKLDTQQYLYGRNYRQCGGLILHSDIQNKIVKLKGECFKKKYVQKYRTIDMTVLPYFAC